MNPLTNSEKIFAIANALNKAHYAVAFTGAGVSVESGIPSFRGENGIWNRYNPISLELGYFYAMPERAWEVIKEIFYDMFGKASPNPAHEILAKLEAEKKLKTIITQNIDNLHQDAGSQDVIEYHGTCSELICKACGEIVSFAENIFRTMPPRCEHCNGILKPNFVFFGELIPDKAHKKSMEHIQKADLILVIGTTGEVMPACELPRIAKENGATIIEINPEPSAYTHSITDIYLPMKAGEAMQTIWAAMNSSS